MPKPKKTSLPTPLKTTPKTRATKPVKARKASKLPGKSRGRGQPGMGDTVAFDPAAQLRAAGRRLRPRDDEAERDRRSAVLNRLWDIIESRKGADPEASHSARLMERGRSRVAQKFGEEAIECLIEAVAGRRSELIGESADVLYHLLVVWVDAGIRPEEVWEELEHREDVSRLADEKNAPLKRLIGRVNVGTTKIP